MHTDATGRGAEHAVALLEPFNGATENTVARQGIGHMVRHHAEVLTYDHAAAREASMARTPSMMSES